MAFSMKSLLYPACAVLVLFFVTFTNAKFHSAGRIPAMLAGINANGLTHLANQILPSVFKQLTDVEIPDQSTSSNSFDITVTNIAMHSVDYSNFTLGVAQELTLSVTGLGAVGSCVWGYQETVWPHVPYGGGSAIFSVLGGSIKLGMKVNEQADSNGVMRPYITIDNSDVTIDKIDIKFSGSIYTWLYQFIVDLFSSTLKIELEKSIKAALHTTLADSLNKVLATAPYSVNLGDWGVVDYSLTADASYLPAPISSAFLPIVGEISPQNKNATHCPYPHTPLQYKPSGKMGDAMLDIFMINSGLYTYKEAGEFDMLVTNADLPPSVPFKMYTNLFNASLPQLQMKYPNMEMELNFTLNDIPSVSSNTTQLTVFIPMLIDFLVLPPGENAISAFKVAAYIQVPLTMAAITNSAGQAAMQFQLLTSLKLDLALVSTTIGPFSVEPLQDLTTDVVNDFVIIQVNNYLKDGMVIPTPEGVTLVNLDITLPSPSVIQVSSDIVYTPTF